MAGLFCGLSVGMAAAQDEPITTLHVYANTIQIPVLVLGGDGQPMGAVAPGRFGVRIDGGPSFRATHVRPEGDDPISLAIVMDVSEPETEILAKLEVALAGLSPGYLHARDRVSVYALDCALIKSLDDVAVDSATVKRGVDAVLESWRDHGQPKRARACKQPVQLWDALVFVANTLRSDSGRRVILALTGGHDSGSVHTWNELRFFTQKTGVAIFGLVYVPGDPEHSVFEGHGYEDPFESVCGLSGGAVFTANGRDVARKLQQVITAIRSRYIVEFPRPYNSTAGDHAFEVKIAKSNAIVRPAGISVPLPDPAELSDPSTVRGDPTQTPEQGTRRVIAEPH